MQEHDPFSGLDEWARDTERRVRRERRFGRLRRRAFAVLGGLIVLALVVIAVPVVRSLLPYGGSDAVAYPTASVPGGISVTTSPGAASTATASTGAASTGAASTGAASTGAASTGPASTGPFAGTPAAGYPAGRAGITLPKATAVAGFTAVQVGAALAAVRSAMIAARLDRTMLVGHDPGPFVALLARNQRAGVRGWFRSRAFDTVATWIDPAVRLDPAEQPRVSGRVTYTSTRVDGLQTLRVTTNFVWAYAFAGTNHPIAVAHDEIRWEFPATVHLRAGDEGMWIAHSDGYVALVDCAAAARGLLAPTRPDGGAPPGARDTEDPDAYLSADHSLEITDNCGFRSPAPSR